MKKPLISVIVPVYKVEAYLDKCVESIVNQTYQNLEIILVDDGSPDKCPDMCDEWAEKDCRIKVIHKENGGSAQARNVALAIVKGEYIAFADSDDVMKYDMLSILYEIALENEADIVECDYSINEEEFEKRSESVRTIICDAQQAMKGHIHDVVFRQVIWNKLYKKSVINDIRFTEGKSIDDEFWTYKVIGNAKKLIHIQKKLYFYRQQDGSVMHQKYSLKRLAGVEAHVERHNYISCNFPELYEESLVRLWFDCRYHGQMAFLNLGHKEIVEVFEYLKIILRDFPLSFKVISQQKLKEAVWLAIEKISLKTVCKLRNVLQVGL